MAPIYYYITIDIIIFYTFDIIIDNNFSIIQEYKNRYIYRFDNYNHELPIEFFLYKYIKGENIGKIIG